MSSRVNMTGLWVLEEIKRDASIGRCAFNRVNEYVRIKAPIPKSDPSFVLHYAIRKYTGNLKTVKRLLKLGPYINVKNTEFETVLHEAVMNKYCDVNLVKTLLEKKPTLINCLDLAMKSALHLALLRPGNDAVINELLIHGADVNARDCKKDTPLHIAAFTGHNSFSILLKWGADVNARNVDGETPLLFSLCETRKKGVLNIPLIKALLSKGADINACSSSSESMLHRAVKSGLVKKSIIKLLLEYGAKPNIPDSDSCTPIVYCKNKEIGKLLIQHSIFSNIPYDIHLSKKRIESDVLNLDYCRNSENYIVWICARELCLIDIESMMSDQITSNCTLFEYIYKIYNGENVTKFSSLEFVSVLSRFAYNVYPACKDILYACIKRHELLSILSHQLIYAKSFSPCNKVKEEPIILNSDCVLHLAKYLSNKDLISLTLAYVNHIVL